MTYTGTEPFAKLTDAQVQAIEEAISRAPDPAWHDGIWRELHARLEGDGPWSDDEVRAAAKQALADLGITLEAEDDDDDNNNDHDDNHDDEADDEPLEDEELEPEPELEEAEPEPKPKRRSVPHHLPKRRPRR